MFLTPDALLAHAVGDYVLQPHGWATTKVSKTVPALAHVAVYGLCFLPLTRNPVALAFIVVTHFFIDRFRLARFVIWAKNWMSPGVQRPWVECSGTGFSPDVPPWLAVWLLIIVDNILHVALNGLALQLWP